MKFCLCFYYVFNVFIFETDLKFYDKIFDLILFIRIYLFLIEKRAILSRNSFKKFYPHSAGIKV